MWILCKSKTGILLSAQRHIPNKAAPFTLPFQNSWPNWCLQLWIVTKRDCSYSYFQTLCSSLWIFIIIYWLLLEKLKLLSRELAEMVCKKYTLFSLRRMLTSYKFKILKCFCNFCNILLWLEYIQCFIYKLQENLE